jgi:hypothetical protein
MPKKKIKIKIKKSTKPGFRVPTPPPSKRFKSIKDYKRKKVKVKDLPDYAE